MRVTDLGEGYLRPPNYVGEFSVGIFFQGSEAGDFKFNAVAELKLGKMDAISEFPFNWKVSDIFTQSCQFKQFKQQE